MQLERTSDSSWEDEPSGLGVAVGDVLDGKYRVVRVLGKGGMGVIMAAVHLELGHRVALKFLLKNAIHNEDVVARFAREARAAAMIQSEHATRVFDVGRLPTGEPYMVLELLDGSDLGAMLTRQGPLPVDDAVTWVIEACEAIAEAHSLGIVHRDLKPDNLFLAKRPDGSRIVKVLDFGISKLPLEKNGRAGKGSPLTTTSAVIGSPMYMSPEQLRATRDVDPRTDIWSLGVTLYELVTGEGPFPWHSLPELCAAILKDQPTPIRALRKDVPAELEAVLLRCLEKDPNDRFADVGELAAALSLFGRPEAEGSSKRVMRLLGRPEAQAAAVATRRTWPGGDIEMAPPSRISRAPASLETQLRTTMPDPRQSLVPPSISTPPVSSTTQLDLDPPLSIAASQRRRQTQVVAVGLSLVMGVAMVCGKTARRTETQSFARKAMAATLDPAITRVSAMAEEKMAEIATSSSQSETAEPAPAPKARATAPEKKGPRAAPRPLPTATPPEAPRRPKANPFADRE